MLLYGAFAVFALRSLFTLMQQHRKVHLYLLKKEAKQAKRLEAENKLKQQLEAKQAQQTEHEQQNQAA